MQVENAHMEERVGVTASSPSPASSDISGSSRRSGSSGAEPVHGPSRQYGEGTAVAKLKGKQIMKDFV